MNRLDDKVALITGGARGQGAAEAELFVNAGAHVVITDVLDAEGDATAERLGAACEFLHHDVASEDQWASVVDTIIERHGRLDVLVNNAGIFRTVGLIETSLEMWQQMMDINQTGVFLGMRNRSASHAGQWIGQHHQYLIDRWHEVSCGGARVLGIQVGRPGYDQVGRRRARAVWCAGQLGPSGHHRHQHAARVRPGRARFHRDTNPDGRVASAEEVGKLVLFLASDDSSYCSGHEFVIDGAMIA